MKHLSSHYLKKQQAFTLLELLIVIAVMVLLAALGVAAFKGGGASDGSRGASYAAASLLDAARNEAIMRRVKTRVIFDTVTNATYPENYLHRMTAAYSPDSGNTWIQSSRWIKFPANAYFDILTPSGGNPRSRAYDTNMALTSFGSGVTSGTAGYWAYEFLPNGQASYGTNSPTTTPLKAVFTPGSTVGGTLVERANFSSLYGLVIYKLGQVQQFADLNSLTNCP